MKIIYRNSLLYWLPMPIIGFLNGLFRGVVLLRILPEEEARQLSSVLLLIWILVYAGLVYDKLKVYRTADAWRMGFIWVGLTVVFEFLLGLSLGMSFQNLVSEYNIAEGRLWALVLAGILFTPVLFFGSRGPVLRN